MARARFPEDADKAVFSGPAGTLILITTDERGNTPADIVTYPGGSAISGSKVALDSNGNLPDFYSPDPAPAVLYAFSPGSKEGTPLTGYHTNDRDYILVDGGPP